MSDHLEVGAAGGPWSEERKRNAPVDLERIAVEIDRLSGIHAPQSAAHVPLHYAKTLLAELRLTVERIQELEAAMRGTDLYRLAREDAEEHLHTIPARTASIINGLKVDLADAHVRIAEFEAEVAALRKPRKGSRPRGRGLSLMKEAERRARRR